MADSFGNNMSGRSGSILRATAQKRTQKVTSATGAKKDQLCYKQQNFPPTNRVAKIIK